MKDRVGKERDGDEIATLVDAVRQSPKYRHVSADLVATIARRELARRGSRAEAIKETRSTLHQVAGAYIDGRIRYAACLDDLALAGRSGDPEALRGACRRIMRHHASTRERLPLLDSFYRTTLAGLPPVSSVIDVACGLNPLAIPWMPLATGASYLALDIYGDMIEFLGACFPLLGLEHGRAQMRDVSSSCAGVRADVALVLKAVPTLEHVTKGAGMDLLRALDAPYLLVSFPVRSLGGRHKGMAQNYGDWFRAAARAEGWQLEQFVFSTELAFIVGKP